MQDLAGYVHVSAGIVAKKISRGENVLLVDVRAHWEFADHRMPGALHLPLDSFPDRVSELNRDAAIILICEHGVRSESAARYLAAVGFTDVATMDGGMAAYEGAVIRG